MNNTTDFFMDTALDLFSNNATDENRTTTTSVYAYPMSFPGRHLILYTRYFVRAYTYSAYLTGIPGNFLTLVILARMRPVASVQVWLTGLSFVDFLTLTVRGCIVPFQAYKLMGYSDAQCIFQYICNWTSEYCNYMFFLGMTTERFIAVWFPLKMAFLTSPKKAAIGMLTIFTVIFTFQLHHIWTFFSTSLGCFTRMEFYAFWNDVWVDNIEAFVVRAIPLFSVLVLNILIIIRLRLNRGSIKDAMSDGQMKEKQKQEKQINRLLSVATVFFFVSLMPDIIYRLTNHLWGDFTKSWPLARDMVITLNAFAALRVGNHAGNFFCYIIVARKFRGELLYLVTCGHYGEHNGVKGSKVKVAGK